VHDPKRVIDRCDAAPHSRRSDVGIVVEDIDAAIEFFIELGLTLEGRMPVASSPISMAKL
jgi:hypothetical protein